MVFYRLYWCFHWECSNRYISCSGWRSCHVQLSGCWNRRLYIPTCQTFISYVYLDSYYMGYYRSMPPVSLLLWLNHISLINPCIQGSISWSSARYEYNPHPLSPCIQILLEQCREIKSDQCHFRDQQNSKPPNGQLVTYSPHWSPSLLQISFVDKQTSNRGLSYLSTNTSPFMICLASNQEMSVTMRLSKTSSEVCKRGHSKTNCMQSGSVFRHREQVTGYLRWLPKISSRKRRRLWVLVRVLFQISLAFVQVCYSTPHRGIHKIRLACGWCDNKPDDICSWSTWW